MNKQKLFERNVPGTLEILQKSTVGIAGCGGLGSNAAVSLVRAGIGKLILADLEMLGVDDFADSQVTIKFRIKTLPIKQWEVSREFRRRLKNRFDELGIEIPFPHRTLYWGVGEDNDWLRQWAGHTKKK